MYYWCFFPCPFVCRLSLILRAQSTTDFDTGGGHGGALLAGTIIHVEFFKLGRGRWSN